MTAVATTSACGRRLRRSCRLRDAEPMRQQLDDVAAEQAGVVSRQQALAAGLTSSQVGHLVRSRRWQRLHPGVFATTSGEVSAAALGWAARLHAGPEAVLSHESAGVEQGLLDDAPATVHVMVPANHRVVARPGVRVHRSRRLGERRHPARTPPQTRVEHTVLDLVDLVDPARPADDVVALLTRACQRRLTTPAKLRTAMRGRARQRHRGLVEQVLRDVEDGVASPLERRYARDVERAHGLPSGRRNLGTGPQGRRRYRDVDYAAFATTVELDGRAYHPVDARALDDERDNAVVLSGSVVLRYGWAAVARRPCEVAAQVAAVLTARGWSGRPRPCGGSCGIASSWQGASA